LVAEGKEMEGVVDKLVEQVGQVVEQVVEQVVGRAALVSSEVVGCSLGGVGVDGVGVSLPQVPPVGAQQRYYAHHLHNTR
jgi:hypothetical protein